MLKAALLHVMSSLPADAAFFENACQKGLAGFWQGDHAAMLRKAAEQPFARVSYTDCIRILSAHHAAARRGNAESAQHGEGSEGDGKSGRAGGDGGGKSATGKTAGKKKTAARGGFVIAPEWGQDLAAEHPELLERLKRRLLERHAEVREEGVRWEFP